MLSLRKERSNNDKSCGQFLKLSFRSFLILQSQMLLITHILN